VNPVKLDKKKSEISASCKWNRHKGRQQTHIRDRRSDSAEDRKLTGY